VAATAGGRVLGKDRELRLRARELSPVLEEFRGLADAERKPALEDPRLASPPRRPVPEPPEGGVILRGFCTYMRDRSGQIVRSREFYYKENPDRWAAETQSDMLWLTRAEWQSFISIEPKVGDTLIVAPPIQERFFSTIAIDYMEGSVRSLKPRETRMTLTVERVAAEAIDMRLDGHGILGEPFDEALRRRPDSRGSEIRLLGFVRYDRRQAVIDRFDVVGLGEAWGNNGGTIDREVRLAAVPWRYGIACELVRGDSPIDRIPPYNMLHYGGGEPYFGRE
jgi:hypothetical protein